MNGNVPVPTEIEVFNVSVDPLQIVDWLGVIVTTVRGEQVGNIEELVFTFIPIEPPLLFVIEPLNTS